MIATPDAPGGEDLGHALDALRRAVVRMLRTSVTVTAYAFLVALVGYAAFHATGVPAAPITVSSSVLGAAFTAPSEEGIILVALLVLGLTPLGRVCLSFGYFAWVRDRSFTILTFFVLLVLLASVSIGASL